MDRTHDCQRLGAPAPLGPPGHSLTSAAHSLHCGDANGCHSHVVLTEPGHTVRRATVLTLKLARGHRRTRQEQVRGCLSDADASGHEPPKCSHTGDSLISASLPPTCWCDRLVITSAHVEPLHDQKPPLQPSAPGNSSSGLCAEDHGCLPGSLWDRPGAVFHLAGSTQAPQRQRPSCSQPLSPGIRGPRVWDEGPRGGGVAGLVQTPSSPVLTGFHGRVPGVHSLQNRTDVLLQPAHGGRLFPEKV